MTDIGNASKQKTEFSEELFQTIFSQAGDGIFLADEREHYIEVNPRGCEMLGYTRDEILDMSIHDLLLPDEISTTPIKMAELQAGKLIVSERSLRRKNGTPLPVEISAKRLSNGHLLGQVRDISERKLAEQSMRELADQWQATFDATSDAILLLSKEHRILRSNRAMQTLFQTSEKEMAGRFCWEIVHGSETHIPDCPVCRVMVTLQRESMELQRDGRWLDVTVDPLLNEKGVLLAVIHIVRDVTERKLAEEAIRQTERHYKALIEHAPDGIVLVSMDGRFRYLSPSALRIFGYTQEETIHSDPAGLTHPEELPALIAAFDHLIEHPSQVRVLQYRFRHKDGSWRWLESTFSNLLSEPGVEAFVINFRDITEQRQIAQAVQESEEKYRQLFDLGADALFLIDNESGRIQDANSVAASLYGYRRDELLQLRNVDLSVEPDETRKATLTGVTQIPIRFHHRKNGEIFPVEINASHISYRGRPAHIAAIRDISERIRAEQALIDSEVKFRSLVEQSPDGIIIVDEQGYIVEWNYGQEQISGLKRSDVLGQPIWEIQYRIMADELKTPDFMEQLRAQTLGALQAGRGMRLNQPRETIFQQTDGTRRNVEVVMYTYKTDMGYRVGSITRDISERKQVEKRLEYLAMHDGLTGLPNRQLFNDRLTQALERARRESPGRLAVMLLDLDSFKDINDTYGHACGDQLLCLAAQRLQNCLRKSDTAARMGGDEFTIIAEDVVSLEHCERVAKKVLAALFEPMDIDGNRFQITASLGISMYPSDSDNATTLLRYADIAMYRAKTAGNSFQFYSLPDGR